MTTDKQRKNYGLLLLENEIDAIRKVLTEFDEGVDPHITINGVQLSGYGVCRATANTVCKAIQHELERSLVYLQKEKERLNEQSENV